jgi:hypothetical protein
MGNYPEEKVLKQIQKYDILKDGVDGLLKILEENWEYKEDGFRLTGRHVRKLECHTYGWSGNEDIINALGKNLMFWPLYWVKSTRGGHHYFIIKEMKKAKKSTDPKKAGCPRCGNAAIIENPLCDDCQKKFDEMKNTLKLAYINQRGHPEKETLWVHVIE